MTQEDVVSLKFEMRKLFTGWLRSSQGINNKVHYFVFDFANFCLMYVVHDHGTKGGSRI